MARHVPFEHMDISAGSLVLRAVKLTYDFWKDARTDKLALSEDAKDVLGRMQTDPTDNGVFVDATGLGDSGCSLLCTHHDITISTTRRVVSELEAKGLVTTVRDDRGKFPQEHVKLTHFGWILNPKTGKVDKVG